MSDYAQIGSWAAFIDENSAPRVGVTFGITYSPADVRTASALAAASVPDLGQFFSLEQGPLVPLTDGVEVFPVPEPSSITLFALGGAAALGTAWFRKRLR